METIRIIRVPNEGESVELCGVTFTYGVDVGINKKNYHQSALNLAKALLDIGCLVRVRRDVYKETKNENGNTIKSVGTEIDFTPVVEKIEKPKNKVYFSVMPTAGDNIKTDSGTLTFDNSIFRRTLVHTLECFMNIYRLPGEVKDEGEGIFSIDMGDMKVLDVSMTSGDNDSLNKKPIAI